MLNVPFDPGPALCSIWPEMMPQEKGTGRAASKVDETHRNFRAAESFELEGGTMIRGHEISVPPRLGGTHGPGA
jgi:hypothetical protein